MHFDWLTACQFIPNILLVNDEFIGPHLLSTALKIMWLAIQTPVSFNELFCSRPKLLCYDYKTRKKKPYKRTIQTNHNFTCLELSTLSPELIQGKFFLALTSAKEKKVDFFLLFLSLRTIIIFYWQMQKLYMNAANHSGPHLFFAHLWYCTHHWCWLSRNKVNTVLSSNKVPVIRSLKLLYWLSWARKISQLLWLSAKKNE